MTATVWLTKAFTDVTQTQKIDLISSYICWLVDNAGVRDVDWWFNEGWFNVPKYVRIVSPEDAVIFRLKFNL